VLMRTQVIVSFSVLSECSSQVNAYWDASNTSSVVTPRIARYRAHSISSTSGENVIASQLGVGWTESLPLASSSLYSCIWATIPMVRICPRHWWERRSISSEEGFVPLPFFSFFSFFSLKKGARRQNPRITHSYGYPLCPRVIPLGWDRVIFAAHSIHTSGWSSCLGELMFPNRGSGLPLVVSPRWLETERRRRACFEGMSFSSFIFRFLSSSLV